MSEPHSASALWPTHALRAWLEALSGQIHRARDDLERRINSAEKELARMRRLQERASHVLQSLHDSIGKVDARLHQAATALVHESAGAQTGVHKSPEQTDSEIESAKKKESSRKEENRPAGGRGTRG
ncbi:MAG TPA: hypothetical protein VMA09_19605 [Candidatus Binataceae bacterium]|nr:hypothetical protein [Candidatus Binataceae bacterium]